MKALLLKVAATLESLLLPMGPWGLIAVAFLDSALLPLPHAIDVWVITLSIRNPGAMALYAAVATIGSVAGCLILYYIARRGGHAAAEHRVGKARLARIRAWFERYEFLTIMVPAIMPPPTPLKAFIIAAGVVEVHMAKFLVALLLGRMIRYFSEAFLAVRYGLAVWHLLLENGPLFLGLLVAGIILAGIAYRYRRNNILPDASGKA
mgnify:CR=1 FL=1